MSSRHIGADSLPGYGSVSGYGSLDTSPSSQHLTPGCCSPVRSNDSAKPKSILKKSNSNIESGSITYVDSSADKSYDSLTDEDFKYFFEDEDDVGIVVSKSVESSPSLLEDELLSLASSDPADGLLKPEDSDNCFIPSSNVLKHAPVTVKDSGIAVTPDHFQSSAIATGTFIQGQGGDEKCRSNENVGRCSTRDTDSSKNMLSSSSF